MLDYHTLLEAAPHAIIEMDRSGVCRWANRRAAAFFRRDLAGEVARKFLPSSNAMGTLIENGWAGRPMPLRCETRAEAVDGGDRIFAWSATRLEEEVLGDERLLLIARDITEQRRLEEQLRDSEAKYRVVVNHAGDGILIADQKDHRFLFANPAACSMLGYEEEELLAMRIEDIHPPEEVPRAVSDFRARVQEGKEAAENIICRRRDGSLFTAEILTSPTKFAGHAALMGLFRDVTEHRKQEGIIRTIVDGALSRAGREFFRKAAEQIAQLAGMDMVLIGELDETDPNRVLGIAVYRDGAPIPTFDYDLDDTPCAELAMKRETCYPQDVQSIFPGNSLLREWKVEGYLGLCLTDSGDKPVGIMAGMTHEPMTRPEFAMSIMKLMAVRSAAEIERRRITRARSESDRRLQTLMSNLPGMAYRCRFNGPRTMEFVSEGSLALTGRSPGEPLHYEQLIHPEDRDMVRLQISGALLRKEPFLVTYRIVTADGERKWVWERGRGIPPPDDGPEVLEGFIADITEQKLAEEDIEKFVMDLEEKNEELEQFIHTVSHDLKSPLITIKGFLTRVQLALGKGNVAKVERDLRRVTAAADKLLLLLDKLAHVAKVGRSSYRMERIPVHALVHDAVELLAERLREKNVLLTIDPDMPEALADRVRMTEVFQNLIENAIKYNDKPVPQIEIGFRDDGPVPVCFVRDNGKGIDPAYHDRIFGLFERLDTDMDGTGAGLAIVKRIIQMHDGRIWVESRGEGLGSTFCFVLPKE